MKEFIIIISIALLIGFLAYLYGPIVADIFILTVLALVIIAGLIVGFSNSKCE